MTVELLAASCLGVQRWTMQTHTGYNGMDIMTGEWSRNIIHTVGPPPFNSRQTKIVDDI